MTDFFTVNDKYNYNYLMNNGLPNLKNITKSMAIHPILSEKPHKEKYL